MRVGQRDGGGRGWEDSGAQPALCVNPHCPDAAAASRQTSRQLHELCSGMHEREAARTHVFKLRFSPGNLPSSHKQMPSWRGGA